ncbi:hypothetical protein [Yinghuangia seranimata]|uniref:hypothetical protein n=1 Tax=Yinghuangia seranimata TaxID=408067 RepID=UPI00248AC385|nr:hypothetical protein [Yinghuangia seranimata]MDI2126434.1 hypothetical protein [Yinghuangia seranimata]
MAEDDRDRGEDRSGDGRKSTGNGTGRDRTPGPGEGRWQVPPFFLPHLLPGRSKPARRGGYPGAPRGFRPSTRLRIAVGTAAVLCVVAAVLWCGAEDGPDNAIIASALFAVGVTTLVGVFVAAGISRRRRRVRERRRSRSSSTGGG